MSARKNQPVHFSWKAFFLFFILLATAIFFIVATTHPSIAATQNPKKMLRSVLQHNHKAVCTTKTANKGRCHVQVVTNNANQPLAGGSPYIGSMGPSQFHSAYSLPCTPNGPVQSTCATPSSFGPQTVAIVDAYHDPNIENDLATYDNYYSLPQCTKANGCLTVVNQNGGSTLPATVDSGWVLETSLDVETAHAICQTCKILLVEATSTSITDLGTGVNTAANLGSTAISNSYGGSEWSSESSYNSYYNHPGIAITASSGDSGYGSEFPAAAPNVIAVGGTTLQLYSDNTYASESVWSGTGSGCSTYESASSWQTNLSNWSQTGCSAKRGIVDVAADADPNTGAAIYDSTPYSSATGWFQVGGTSLASPIIASIYALTGGIQANTNAVSIPYNSFTTASFHNVSSGTNGFCSTIMCQGGVGYNGPTGLGTPNGISGFMLNATVQSPTPTQTPTPSISRTPIPTNTPKPTATPTPTKTSDTTPSVTITYPTNNSVVSRRAYLSVSANASDNVSVTKVQFYRNNSLNCTDTTAPYSCNMYTANSRYVNVTYKAVAYDAAGNKTTASVTVQTQ